VATAVGEAKVNSCVGEDASIVLVGEGEGVGPDAGFLVVSEGREVDAVETGWVVRIFPNFIPAQPLSSPARRRRVRRLAKVVDGIFGFSGVTRFILPPSSDYDHK